MSEKPEDLPYFANTLIHDTELSSTIQQLLSLAENTGSPLENESVLFSLLSTLILRHGNKPPKLCRTGSHVDAINRACEFMEAHYDENISLNNCRGGTLARFIFSDYFEKQGISPHEFLAHSGSILQKILDEGKDIAV
jgi:hypothetical protein